VSRTLTQTNYWATSYINYISPTVGANNEPSVTNANNVKQLFLSPDVMTFSWNRTILVFQTQQGQQDYTFVLPTFGYLETASLQPSASITNVQGNGTTATITASNNFLPKATVTITGLATTAFNGVFAILTASSTQFTFASATSQSSTPDSGLAISGQIFQVSDIRNTEPLAESSDQQRPNAISVQRDLSGYSATITNITISSNVLTVTATNTFSPGMIVTFSGLTHATFLNGQSVTILTASSSQFTAYFVHANYPTGSGSSADTGTAAGGITFRFMGVPDGQYQAILNYQQGAVPFVTTSDNWGPIPDRYAYIYNRLYLGETLQPIDAQAAQMEKQRGILALVSIAEGLEMQDKLIFVQQYLNLDAQQAANLLGAQQGVQAKASK
jgi:hypothetical protein